MIEFEKLNGAQKQAVLHALTFGSPVEPGGHAYVIMSLVPDYLVQGTFDSQAMAERIMSGKPNAQDRANGWTNETIATSLLGWTVEQEEGRDVVHTIVRKSEIGPSFLSLSEIIPTAHPDWTNCAPAEIAKKRRGKQKDVSIRDVTRVRVTITLRKGKGEKRARTLSATLGPRVDAVFLTRGAHELFVFPAYERAFGTEYVKKLRVRLRMP